MSEEEIDVTTIGEKSRLFQLGGGVLPDSNVRVIVGGKAGTARSGMGSKVLIGGKELTGVRNISAAIVLELDSMVITRVSFDIVGDLIIEHQE